MFIKNSDYKINFIKSKDCIDLRSRILRPHQPLELCRFAEDDFESTFHLGVCLNNIVVSNGTFMKSSCEHFLDETFVHEIKNPYRLRGMATDTPYQGQGFGRLILQEAEKNLHQLKCDFLWFNARQNAFEFYKKLNFLSLGPLFEISGTGPHQVMYKKLNL